VDSTGIKAEGEGEWNARKHGGPKRRLWRKIHIGVKTSLAKFAEVKPSYGVILINDFWAALCGDGGVGITAAAASKQRCIV
jgi:hypothetical protein